MRSTIALAAAVTRAAAVGVKARFRDAVALDPHRDAHQVATGGASGGAGVRAGASVRPCPWGALRCSANDRIEGNGNARAAASGEPCRR